MSVYDEFGIIILVVAIVGIITLPIWIVPWFIAELYIRTKAKMANKKETICTNAPPIY
jgi:hypothetical protein